MDTPSPVLKLSESISGLGGDVMCVRFAPGNKRVAAACSDGFIRIYNTTVPTKMVACLKAEDAANPHACTCLRFFRGDKTLQHQLIATYTSGKAIRWHSTSNKVMKTYEGLTSLLCVDIRSDNKEYIVAGESEDVEVIDVATNQRKYVLGLGGLRLITVNSKAPQGHSNRIFGLMYHPKKETLIVSGGWDRTVQIWDTEQKEAVRYISDVFVCGEAIAIDPENGHILTGSYRNKKSLQLWSFETLEAVDDFSEGLSECWVYACQFSKKDPKYVAMAGAKANEVRLFQTDNKQCLGRFLDTRGLYSLDFSSDGDILAVGGASRTVYLLSVNPYGQGTVSYAPGVKKTKASANVWEAQPPPEAGDLPQHIVDERRKDAGFSFDDPVSGPDSDSSDDEQ